MTDLQPDISLSASGHIVSACQPVFEIHNRALRTSIMHHGVANASANDCVNVGTAEVWSAKTKR
jgi:hypothetical protein